MACYYLGCIRQPHFTAKIAPPFFLAGKRHHGPDAGKVGELLKSYLLRRVDGTPVARSAPIVMAGD